MSSFSNTSIRILLGGALILGAGVLYQGYASHSLQEAQRAVQKVQSTQAKAESSKQNAELYVQVVNNMADRQVDHKEPFSVVSEFSPEEVSKLDDLLASLYHRDGHFFLKKFKLAWRDENKKLGLLPRVSLDLEGRKVLQFSHGQNASLATNTQP